MAAAYVLQAVEAGYIALVFTNASRAMPPWGGREALFGTSPFAAGAPGGYVLDMSPAVAARGKIRRAARRGEKIPEGYALDKGGRSTTDPTAARSEEHTSELLALMRISFDAFCLHKKQILTKYSRTTIHITH